MRQQSTTGSPLLCHCAQGAFIFTCASGVHIGPCTFFTEDLHTIAIWQLTGKELAETSTQTLTNELIIKVLPWDLSVAILFLLVFFILLCCKLHPLLEEARQMLPTLCTTQSLVQSEHPVRILPRLALTLVVILEEDCPNRNIKALHEIGNKFSSNVVSIMFWLILQMSLNALA